MTRKWETLFRKHLYYNLVLYITYWYKLYIVNPAGEGLNCVHQSSMYGLLPIVMATTMGLTFK